MENENESNFARFATMLIDLGAKTVRNLFDSWVQSKHNVSPGKLLSLYGKPIVKKKMYDNRDLFGSVYNDIISKFHSSRSYDLTELILVISVLELVAAPSTGWQKKPEDSDKSTGAQLVRLRFLRNNYYAHLTCTADLHYPGKYEELQEILCSIGAEKSEIDSYKEKFTLEELRKKYKALMEKDVLEIRRIFTKLEQLEHSQNKGFENMMEKLKIRDSDNDFPEKVLEAFQLVGINLDQKLSILHEENSVMLKKQLAQVTMIKPVVDSLLLPSLEPIGQVLAEGESVFRILVKTCVKEVKDDNFHHSSVENLANACGRCQWNVVIDLQFETEDMTFRRALCKAMSVESKVITYQKLENLTKEDCEQVAASKKSLWILANGGLETPPCLTEFAQTEHEIGTLLYNLVRTIEKKPVQSVLLLMSDASEEEMEAVKAVTTQIKKALDSWTINITAESSFQVCLALEDVAAKWFDGAIKDIPLYSSLPIRKKNRPDPMIAKAPIVQLTTLFTSTLPSSETEDNYYLPGSEGECAIGCAQFKKLSLDMTIYHKDIGCLIDASQKEAIKVNFLKGASITPEVLRLQKTDPPVYVVRKEMTDCLKKITAQLKSRKSLTYKMNTNSIYTLKHSPSAGGTTCGRYLLFKLRKKFPSIQIDAFSENLLTNLKYLFDSTKLPLFLVVEATEFGNNVSTLQDRLRDKWVKSLVLVIEQQFGNEDSRSSPSDDVITLDSKLCDEDHERFEKLFDASKPWKGYGNKTVFQFGILTFLGEFSRIQKHIQDCTSVKSGASDSQLRILRALCFLSKYSPTKLVKRSLILRYFNSREDHNEMTLSAKLGSLSDFVVTEQDKNGFAVCKVTVNCLIDPLLQRCRERLQSNRMADFLLDLIELVKLDISKDKSDSSDLVRGLFIDRNQSEDGDESPNSGEKSKQVIQRFTNFVLDLEKECGAEKVAQFMQSIVNLFPPADSGAHFRALRARYLMYQLKRDEEAIREIKETIGLKASSIVGSTVTNDQILVVQYGQLIMKRAKDCIRSQKSGAQSNLLRPLKMFQTDVVEAVEAYRRAQERTPHPGYNKGQYNSYPFIAEAQARYSLLEEYLRLLCNYDTLKLKEYLAASSDAYLKRSHLEASEALQKLEYYRKACLVDTSYSKNTDSIVNGLKWKLTKLVVDRDAPLSEIAKKLSDNDAFDIGWFVLQNKDRSATKKLFKSLDLNDLLQIHWFLDKRFSKGSPMLWNDYKTFISVSICIRQHDPTLTKYSTASAIECADRWINAYPRDFEAYFMRGSLKLVEALDEDGEMQTELFDAACLNFEEAEKLAEETGVKYRWTTIFSIGVGIGLERLISKEDRNNQTTKLQQFTGCLVKKNEVSVFKPGGGHAFSARWSPRDNIDMSETRPQVKFHIALRCAGLLAEDLEYV